MFGFSKCYWREANRFKFLMGPPFPQFATLDSIIGNLGICLGKNYVFLFRFLFYLSMTKSHAQSGLRYKTKTCSSSITKDTYNIKSHLKNPVKRVKADFKSSIVKRLWNDNKLEVSRSPLGGNSKAGGPQRRPCRVPATPLPSLSHGNLEKASICRS